MKRSDIRKANDILDLYMSCAEKIRAQDDIAVSGPTQETKMMEFHGDFPQMSNVKPDILSGKVDKIRKIYITEEEHTAYRCVMALPMDLRLFVTMYRYARNTHNPDTQKPFTHADCAKALGHSMEKYEHAREVLMAHVLSSFERRLAKIQLMRAG